MKNFKKLSLFLLISISYNFCREIEDSSNQENSSSQQNQSSNQNTTSNTTSNNTSSSNTNYTINVNLSSIQKSANNDINKLKKIKGLNANQITQLNNIQNQIIVANNPQQIKMLLQNANQIINSGIATKKSEIKSTLQNDKKLLNQTIQYDKNRFMNASEDLLFGKTIVVKTDRELRDLIKLGKKLGINGLLFGNARLDNPSNNGVCNTLLNSFNDFQIKQISKNYKFIIVYMDTAPTNAQTVAISMGIPDQGKNVNLWGVPYLVDVRSGDLPNLVSVGNENNITTVPVVSPLVVMAATKDQVINSSNQLVNIIINSFRNFTSTNNMTMKKNQILKKNTK